VSEMYYDLTTAAVADCTLVAAASVPAQHHHHYRSRPSTAHNIKYYGHIGINTGCKGNIECVFPMCLSTPSRTTVQHFVGLRYCIGLSQVGVIQVSDECWAVAEFKLNYTPLYHTYFTTHETTRLCCGDC